MTKFALYVPLQAKPGKEKEVADFLGCRRAFGEAGLGVCYYPPLVAAPNIQTQYLF